MYFYTHLSISLDMDILHNSFKIPYSIEFRITKKAQSFEFSKFELFDQLEKKKKKKEKHTRH